MLAVLEDKERRDTHSIPGVDDLDPAAIPQALIDLAASNDRLPGLISLYAVLSAESTTTDHPGAAYFRERTARNRAYFRRGFERMAEEELLAPGVTAKDAGTSTFALWDGIQIHWLIDPTSVSVTETLRRHLRLITTVDV